MVACTDTCAQRAGSGFFPGCGRRSCCCGTQRRGPTRLVDVRLQPLLRGAEAEAVHQDGEERALQRCLQNALPLRRVVHRDADAKVAQEGGFRPVAQQLIEETAVDEREPWRGGGGAVEPAGEGRRACGSQGGSQATGRCCGRRRAPQQDSPGGVDHQQTQQPQVAQVGDVRHGVLIHLACALLC